MRLDGALCTSFMAIWLIFSFLDPYFPTKGHLHMFLRIDLLLLYGCVPIKKIRTERYLTIRYLRHYCFSSITVSLSPPYGISSNLTFIIVGLISLVFTVPTSLVSLAELLVMMLITGSAILLLELLPLYMEKSLGYRVLRSYYYISSFTITLSHRYKLSLSFRSIPFVILLIFGVRIPDVSLARRSTVILSNVYFIFLFDSFSTCIRRYTGWLALHIELDSNDWSELPPEVVHEIVNRLLTFKDFIAAAGVSRTWRSVCLSISRRPQLPWLMLSETLSTDMRRFFSLCDNNRYQLQLSEVQGKRCWGSPHGWVVTLGPDYETHLLHLMKRVQIALPPLNTIRRLAATEEWFHLVHKFILLKDPSHELSFLVIAIFGPANRLAFARVAFNRGGDGAALNRRGQGQWAIVTNPDNLKFNDVACFNDKIYAFCDNGKLVCLELDAPLAAEVQVIAPGPSEEEIDTPLKLYLVETSENLFGIFRYGDRNPLELRHGTTSFSVYKFDFRASAWKEVIDLEDLAVFVGDGNSWCIPTSTILCRSNCIYFTDDNWEWQRYPGVAYGGHDVGVFNMAQTERVIQRLPFGTIVL
ncbi:hypothetical protein CMV_016295 [Castanea mollissima]|uniref:F-box domain-containing protein n=1 Tax=Castanea mollissima TaxID=60419 RepID=A0A8J4R6T1_9ROSI|nr:hypothetical protein CMV_016295 [Castanea mollissima]